MKRKSYRRLLCIAALGLVSLLNSCGLSGAAAQSPAAGTSFGAGSRGNPGASAAGGRHTTTSVTEPSATGSTVYENSLACIDASNASEGYIMVRYTGTVKKVKVQILAPDGITYTYSLFDDAYETFPLQAGSGSYRIDVLENVGDNMYALAFSQDINAAVADEFLPFLYPNQYVWFTDSSEAVKLGRKLSDESKSDLDYIQKVYDHVTHNISYDEEKAQTVEAGYLPDIDATLASQRGICFDYASLMAAMLRSQSIPTKLEIGYSGSAYHAWISVYTKETGWVDGIIQFDGSSWSLMDPTLASNNDSRSVGKYIGDGSNYTVKYYY